MAFNDAFPNRNSSCSDNLGFNFSKVEKIDVEFAFSKITSNAIGLDDLPLKFLRLLLPHIVAQFTKLFNIIIESKCVSSICKLSKVHPKPKTISAYVIFVAFQFYLVYLKHSKI